MIVTFIMYCFVLRWECNVLVEIWRCKGATWSPPYASSVQVSELQVQGDSPQAECFAYVERDFVSASQPNLY
jgi:hypothetical protein